MHGTAIATGRPVRRRRDRLWRPVLIAHRWLGIVIGLLMTMWCLTGFVMLFVDYPRLLPAEQVRGLAPLRLPAPNDWARIAAPADLSLASARLEMMAGRPILRLVPDKADARAIWQARATPLNLDLATGRPLPPLSSGTIATVGATFGHQAGIDGPVDAVTPVDVDQWTVQAFRANRPLYRIDYADPAGSTAYVAGLTGEVVQQTTRFERGWGWVGSVPHWLYPTILRQNPAAWSQVVIWTALTGCFLTVTGLWVGVSRLRRRRDGSVGSPYRGLWWWHHMIGLAFGLLALTWVGSGLFSMNPWGLFDSQAGAAERHRLAGTMRWSALRDALTHLDAPPANTVRVESAPLSGTVALIAIGADGARTRIDADGHPAPLRRQDIAAALRDGPPVAALDLLPQGDTYYYAHKQPASLPVWRARLADAQGTRLYIDARSGALLRTVDAPARTERWLWNAPHSLDLPGLRDGPLRYAVILPLLAAVTIICGTGSWMGLRKLRRDLRTARHRLRSRRLRKRLSSSPRSPS